MRCENVIDKSGSAGVQQAISKSAGDQILWVVQVTETGHQQGISYLGSAGLGSRADQVLWTMKMALERV
jgi:hypothetical protein